MPCVRSIMRDNDETEDYMTVKINIETKHLVKVFTIAVLFDAYFDLICARPMPVYSVPGLVDHF